jgi:hypothetical protein
MKPINTTQKQSNIKYFVFGQSAANKKKVFCCRMLNKENSFHDRIY